MEINRFPHHRCCSSEPVIHPGSFRRQIVLIIWRLASGETNSLLYRNAETMQGPDLLRVVRQEPDSGRSEIVQHRGCARIVPSIDRKAELDIGIDRIKAAILQGIGSDLVRKTDAATLLRAEIDQYAVIACGNDRERGIKLMPAVAPEGAQGVPRRAGAVKAHKWRCTLTVWRAMDERDELITGLIAAIRVGR